MTHVGHKAGHQCLLEHCIPVHVSHVGHILDVTEAGQAALGVLGQQLWSEGKGTSVNDASHLSEHGRRKWSLTQHVGHPCKPRWAVSGLPPLA